MKSSSFVTLIACTIVCVLATKDKNQSKREKAKDEQLPPCQACKTLVNSFTNAMDKTNKKNYGGGDTAWEEEKLGDYSVSETRLIEVQEKLCVDVDRGQNQCYTLAEQWEGKLEEWWFQQKTIPDLFSWLCIEKVQHCCPENHFGPECAPCPGFPDNVCSNNGKCKGAGSRKGNGECSCFVGYQGADCDECAPEYYQAYKDDKKLLCSKCHAACDGPCTSAGPKGCSKCKEGWTADDKGCLDRNECVLDHPCRRNQFCINNEGSYSCLDCDASCDGCHGDGPDMCLKCAQGYSVKDGLCLRTKSWLESPDWTRYLTYLGLSIATCIIFQKNTVVASIIGVAVAFYVSVSEYMLSSTLNKNPSSFESLLDTSEFKPV